MAKYNGTPASWIFYFEKLLVTLMESFQLFKQYYN